MKTPRSLMLTGLVAAFGLLTAACMSQGNHDPDVDTDPEYDVDALDESDVDCTDVDPEDPDADPACLDSDTNKPETTPKWFVGGCLGGACGFGYNPYLYGAYGFNVYRPFVFGYHPYGYGGCLPGVCGIW